MDKKVRTCTRFATLHPPLHSPPQITSTLQDMADENDYVNRGYDTTSDVKYLSKVRRTPNTAAANERCMSYYWPALLPVLDAASFVGARWYIH